MRGTRLLLVRHAETSAPDLFHGAESDVGLSAWGAQQSEWLGRELAVVVPVGGPRLDDQERYRVLGPQLTEDLHRRAGRAAARRPGDQRRTGAGPGRGQAPMPFSLLAGLSGFRCSCCCGDWFGA